MTAAFIIGTALLALFTAVLLWSVLRLDHLAAALRLIARAAKAAGDSTSVNCAAAAVALLDMRDSFHRARQRLSL